MNSEFEVFNTRMGDLFEGRTVKPPPLVPALSPYVHLSLTIVYTALYGFLFLIIYVQLWMILYYKHKRFSYQTVFLFLCLVWAGLRITLFSFYFKNCVLANTLHTFFYWLLYCLPVVLQFITLCLLVLFFSQVVIRSKPKHERDKLNYPLRIACAICIVIFLATNLTCAVIIQSHKFDSFPWFEPLSLVRVVINDSLFIIAAVALSVCIVKMSKISSTSVILEAKGTTKVQAIIASVLIILLYTSRALYNIIAVSKPISFLSFGYGWINVSDQADYLGLDKQNFAYISFGIVLFVWEFLPTFIVVLFFRVQKPRNLCELPSITVTGNDHYNSRAYFFDNPRRYDSDDDLARQPPHSLPDDPYTINSGGSSLTPPYSTQDLGHDYKGTEPNTHSSSMPVLPPPQANDYTLTATDPQFYDGT